MTVERAEIAAENRQELDRLLEAVLRAQRGRARAVVSRTWLGWLLARARGPRA